MALTDEFDKFIEEKTKKKEPTFDSEREKQEWIGFIEIFYTTLLNSIEKYKNSGKLSSEEFDVEITEEYLGTYNVKGLLIHIGGDVLRFIPIGTFLIGAKGRIDLEGPKKSFSFILVDKDSSGPNIIVNMFNSEEERKKHDEEEKNKPAKKIEWTWKLLSIDRDVEFIDLTNEILLKCIMESVDG